MKNVLVLVHDDPGQEARLQAALDLTRMLDGHLTCVDVAVLYVAPGDYAGVGGGSLLVASEAESEEANRARILPRIESEGVAFNWIDVTDSLGEALRQTTALADIIVLSSPLDTAYPDMKTAIGDVLLDSRKPVLAVPSAARAFDPFGHALVAWDGSPEAETAIRAAMPLLQKATSVTLVEIDDGSLKTPAFEAASYLARHEVATNVRTIAGAHSKPATLLIDAAASLKADYVVMGGFGHSRFVEGLFGGVTDQMLRKCPVPLFLAH